MRHIFLLSLVCICLHAAMACGAALPDAFDLRDIDGHSVIGPVRDQGQCGSCWAFGALAAAESTWNRVHGLYDEQAIDFSEAFLVWSISPLYDGLHGCDGGSLALQQNTALIEYGVPLEQDFPYTIEDPGDDLHWDATRYSFSDWYRIPPGDIETIKRVLYNIGAVSTGILVEDDFYRYKEGIFTNQTTAINKPVAFYSSANHLIALVGWNDEPEDGGMGYWILRNSWGTDSWGEDGYMRIRYTTAHVSLFGAYLTLEDWDGENIALENNDELVATAWSAGGTRNAYGVDLWGAAASSAVNRGTIRAEAVSDSELSTARGIYLWGGPEGHVANEGDIDSVAVSTTNQAIAYGVCLQGGQVDNRGRMFATAHSNADQALAFGIWAANGGNALRIDNSGEILAEASGSAMNAAYGIWADSRASITVVNSGRIEALADDYAVGVLLTGGPAVLINNGLIRGDYASVYSLYDTELVLGSGSDLVGSVELWGDNDALLLTGNGSEDEQFFDVEGLTMAGEDWTLSGDSDFDTITVEAGRLAIDGAIGGDTSVAVGAILGGNGTLSGTLVSHGTLAPGASVGHLTIDGDVSLTGAGTLEIEVGDGVADRLTVTGTANLAGTLRVLPDGYAGGGRYTVLKAGTLLGAFDSLSSVAVLDVALDDGTAGSLILDVTRNSYRSLATAFNSGLAASLDGLRPQVAGDLGTLLDSFDLSVSRSDLNNALTDLTPRIHGLAGSVLISGAQNRLADLRRHVRGIIPSQRLENNPTGKTAAWAEVLAQHSRWGRDGGYFGARENLQGLLLGVERTAASGLTLGVAAAVTESRLEARDAADDADLDSQQGYLYAAWRNPRRAGGFHAHATLGGGLCQVEADRVLAVAGRTTRSEHDGYLLGASLGGGYALALGGWTLDPTVGLSFAHVREDGFRESGADGADLKIAARDNDSLQGLLGLSLSRKVQLGGLELEPTVRAEWRHEFDRQPEDVRARLAGGGDRFATPGRDLAGDGVLLGAALQARWGRSLLAGLVYDCDLQSHGATAHALRLRLSVAF